MKFLRKTAAMLYDVTTACSGGGAFAAPKEIPYDEASDTVLIITK